MTTSITPDMVLAAFDKWNVPYRIYDAGWKTYNRNSVQPWGPIHGLVVHNFGSDISDANSMQYLYNGDAARDLPGPLSQFGITDDGVWNIIGWGVANHTGPSNNAVDNLVIADKMPLTADMKGTVTTGSFYYNHHYMGVEMTYGTAPTAAQRNSLVRGAAALMDMLGDGYTGGSIAGHREIHSNRSDPVGFKMYEVRQAVNVLLQAGSTMALTDAEITAIATKVWRADVIPAPHPTTDNPNWQADSYLKWLMLSIEKNGTKLDAVLKALGTPVDVDETTLAASIAPLIVEPIKTAVVAALSNAPVGATPEAIADAVVTEFNTRLGA